MLQLTGTINGKEHALDLNASNLDDAILVARQMSGDWDQIIIRSGELVVASVNGEAIWRRTGW